MKGIILAGGLGTRLYPLTKGVSKQMLPVYDKPMIYYPLSVLVQAGINQVLVISSPEDLPTFQRLLEDGSQFGISIEYKEQPAPDGIAQAFILGEDFIKDDSVCLILGDNIFYGHGLDKLLVEARTNLESYGQATIFGYHVKDPERYGIAELDNYGGIKKIEEKPKQPESNYAIVGLYFYPNSVIEIAKKLIPSSRGELEISSVNQEYLQRNQLKFRLMDRGFAWLDTGTIESLFEAGEYVKALEKRQGLKIGCIEEHCLNQGFISKKDIRELAVKFKNSEYGEYLKNLSLP